jgi:hypothetical protein
MRKVMIVVVLLFVLSISMTFGWVPDVSNMLLGQNNTNEMEIIDNSLGIKLSKDFPIDKPEMSDIEALRDHVAVCAREYTEILVLYKTNLKLGDRLSTMQVLYRYYIARAKLFWAESRWKDCQVAAQSAVSTAKAIVKASYEAISDGDNSPFVIHIDAHAKLTEARLLLAKASSKGQ